MKIEQLNDGGQLNESVISSLAQAEKKTDMAPAGYIKITLSTEGKVGAPAEFHIRNFKTRDIMSLALTEEDVLPERVLSLLGDLIYEKDVDVKQFHENEVIETLLLLYHAFYAPSFDITFPVNEEDYAYIRDNNPAVEAERKIADLESGRWVPHTTISIVDDIHTFDLDSNFKPVALLKSKATGFTIGFRIPRYGDTLIIKKWLRETFKEEEEKFQRTARIFEMQERAMASLEEGVMIDIDSIPRVSEQEEEDYNNFRIRRAGVIVDVIRALHLNVFDGEDVSNKSLAERYEIIQDPRIDEKVARKLDEHFEKLEFGVKPEVSMLNPITQEVCSREYSFRLVDILQAIKVSPDDEYEFISPH